MDQRLYLLADQAIQHADRTIGLDRSDPDWVSNFTEKYTELIVTDLARFLDNNIVSRLSYELIRRSYKV